MRESRKQREEERRGKSTKQGKRTHEEEWSLHFLLGEIHMSLFVTWTSV